MDCAILISSSLVVPKNDCLTIDIFQNQIFYDYSYFIGNGIFKNRFYKKIIYIQVIAAGDLCAICQEKMHAPILLRCKHIFCEDCVSEW